MKDTTTTKRKLLIVDDAETNRETLVHLFSDAYETEQAENGRVALEKLSASPDFSLVILDLIMPVLDGFGVLNEMMKSDRLKSIPVVVVTTEDETERQILALDSGAVDVITKPYNPLLVLHRVNNLIFHREMDKVSQENALYRQMLLLSEIDEMTGIYNKAAFCRHTREVLTENPDKQFCILRWDIDHFKVFNDKYGSDAGDRIIRQTGQYYRDNAKKLEGLHVYGHWDADHFVTLREIGTVDADKLSALATGMMHTLHYDFRCFVHIGVYKITDRSIDVALMCDRALLALRSTKKSFASSYAEYDSSMRKTVIEEQEITGEMKKALVDGQFVPYFQPQYNYAEKKLIGAEALVRWIHPEKGVIPPGKFIPLFEKNGFISEVDKYIWESVCQKMRSWMDKGLDIMPVSVNISRCDVYDEKLCDFLTGLLEKYDIPACYFHTEITESAYSEDTEKIYAAVERLRKCGFQVHMDDFGSSYSSLNMLWTVPVDMIKLDMKFLGNGEKTDRTGSILSSVVRMAHSIKIPVIAEGVETSEQADFLKSIGCLYMQGYYFAKPLPEKDYEALLEKGLGSAESNTRFDTELHVAKDFYEYENQSVLLFNSLVGGAAIIEYDGRNVAILRLNDAFLEELGTTHSEYAEYQLHVLDRFEEP